MYGREEYCVLFYSLLKEVFFFSLRVTYQNIFNTTENTELQSEYVKMWKCGNKTLSLDKPRNNKQQV